MAIFAKKNGDESNDRLQQRFKQQFQKSGVAKLLRERMNFSKKPNKAKVRGSALKREEYRAANQKKRFYSNM